MPPPSEDTLELTVAVNAPAALVWRAVVEEPRRRAWWSYLELDARPGGRLLERWRDADGRTQTTRGVLLEISAPHRLRCSWRDDGWPTATEVELVLRPEGDCTRVCLRHAGWQRLGELGDRLRPTHEEGWRLHLARLKDYVEREAERGARESAGVA